MPMAIVTVWGQLVLLLFLSVVPVRLSFLPFGCTWEQYKLLQYCDSPYKDVMWDCSGIACPLVVVCRCGSLSAYTRLTAICIHSTCR